MKKPFNVDAYTARLIGRESLAKVDSAIIELVKNCYDADANISIVYYDDIEEALYICDNGSGMTEKIISDHWMTIGNSSKKQTYKSDGGRIQTGSKGIGRFALDRIASKCEMLTCHNNQSILWTVNWEDFKPDKLLTEIFADIQETKINFNDFVNNSNSEEFKKLIKTDSFSNNGTIFKLKNFNDTWDKKLQNRIIKSLQNISSPGLNGVFKIYFFDNERTIKDAEINLESIIQGDYKITFKVNNKVLKIAINRNEFDFGSDFEEIMNKSEFSTKDKLYFNGRPLFYKIDLEEFIKNQFESTVLKKLGNFSGKIYFNKIKSNNKDKEKFYYKDITGRRNYSKEFGGIKIYRDNFRVRPYGDYDSNNFDWLMLSQRKQQSPAAVSDLSGTWKVNSEQLTGIINISRATNTMIKDQANRDGLVETDEYNLFKKILLEVISYFERDRQYVLRTIRNYNKIKNEYDEALEHINSMIKEYDKRIKQIKETKKKAIGKAAHEIINDLKKSESFTADHIKTEQVKIVIEEKDNIIRDLADENSLLSTLATTGIVVNMYLHELRTLNLTLFARISGAEDRVKLINEKYKEDDFLIKQNEKIINNLKKAEALKERYNSWYEVTIENIQQNRRVVKEINIIKIFKDIVVAWEKILEPKNIKINLIYNSDEEILFNSSRQEIESIIHNLITNSISAFESKNFKGINKDIFIELQSTDESFILNYRDTGCGLDDYFKKQPKEILKPFVSRKIDSEGEKIGSGMGMWIIDKFVKQYNGIIDLSENKEAKEGFFIKIEFFKRRR